MTDPPLPPGRREEIEELRPCGLMDPAPATHTLEMKLAIDDLLAALAHAEAEAERLRADLKALQATYDFEFCMKVAEEEDAHATDDDR